MIIPSSLLNSYTTNEGSIQNFARSYKKFGLNIDENGDLVYREWAPGAKGLSLVRLSMILKDTNNSLEISTVGTGKAIGVLGMTSVFGPSQYPETAKESSQLSMKAGTSAA